MELNGAPRWKRATRSRMKRVLDLVIAGTGMVVLLPLLLACALIIAATMGRPVLFTQRRAGLEGAPFTMLKFRTMRKPEAEEIWYLTDQGRLTRLGWFLRKLSLDELPQLWNVLRGDMSLVGPRPLIPEYLPHYSERHGRRHLVRPGVTGWAQISGRNQRTYSERFDLDVWYVENWSLVLDLRILATTFIQVFTGRGVVDDGDMAKVDDAGFREALSREAQASRGKEGRP